VNNDTVFAPNFVQRLLDTAHSNAPAAVGSVICDETAPEQLLSIGVVLDTSRLRVRDKLDKLRSRDEENGLHDVDALSGRGTLYPLAAFLAVGTMKPKWLPHYLADYELSVRIRRAGYRLLVTENAVVFSSNEFGNSFHAGSLWRRFFSARSPSYLPAVFLFWWEASTPLQRFTLLPRLVFRSARKKYCRIEQQ
jgi:GT2 family glycosyltransferase